MSKANTELAQKIIEQKAEVSQNEPVTYNDGYDDKGKAINQRTLKSWGFNIPILGMGFAGTGKTKADAVADVVKQLAGELDNGNLHLSDTWAEDNLEG